MWGSALGSSNWTGAGYILYFIYWNSLPHRPMVVKAESVPCEIPDWKYTARYTVCTEQLGMHTWTLPIYGRPPASWPTAIIFYCWCFYHLTLFFFSPSNLGGLWADRHQTLPHVRWCLQFLNVSQKFGGSLPQKIWGPKNIKISDFAL